jgi:hypothetical protein
MRNYLDAVQSAACSLNATNSSEVKNSILAIRKDVQGECAKVCGEVSVILKKISLFTAIGMDTKELSRDLEGTETRRDQLYEVLNAIDRALKVL